MVIVRIEQLAPFPYDHFKATILNYKNSHFIWCQEEHQNFGAWSYVAPRIETVINIYYYIKLLIFIRLLMNLKKKKISNILIYIMLEENVLLSLLLVNI